jgi:hypothetical protein
MRRVERLRIQRANDGQLSQRVAAVPRTTTREQSLRTPAIALLMAVGAASACRSFSLPAAGAGGDAGDNAVAGTDGGGPGAGGSGELSAPSEGGGAGAELHGTAGVGTDSAGQAGEGGSGGVPIANPPVDAGPAAEFGLVSIVRDGHYVCSGTLLTNSWVLTADQCVPPDASNLTVGYGPDRAHFAQVEPVTEIIRFPGNDGSLELRGRDLVLLGVETPIEVAGRSDHVFRLSGPWMSGDVLLPQLCVGWDMGRDKPEEDAGAVVAAVTAFHAELGLAPAGQNVGDRIWYEPLPDADSGGRLPTPNDVGSGCFINQVAGALLVSVHVGNPLLRHDGETNHEQESYSVSLLESPVRAWLDASLMATVADPEPPDVTGGVAGCRIDDEELEIFSVNEALDVESRTGLLAWSTPENLGHPEAKELAREAAGTFCWAGETQAIFARALDGSLWWRRRESEGSWSPDWVEVPYLDSLMSPVAIAPLGADRFDVFARGAAAAIYRSRYRNGSWMQPENLGGVFPADVNAVVWNSERTDVYGIGGDACVWQQWSLDGVWKGWSSLGIPTFRTPIDSPLAAVLREGTHLDLIARSLQGTLLHSFYNSGWLQDWIDTGIQAPASQLKIVSSAGARRDMLGVGADGRLWHGVWPRLPAEGAAARFRR